MIFVILLVFVMAIKGCGCMHEIIMERLDDFACAVDDDWKVYWKKYGKVNGTKSMRKVIIYGAGEYGEEAARWFNAENVAYFIDNDLNKQVLGKIGREVVSFDFFLERYRTAINFYDEYDIVIAIQNRWQVHQIAYELEKNGVVNYNTFFDIKV